MTSKGGPEEENITRRNQSRWHENLQCAFSSVGSQGHFPVPAKTISQGSVSGGDDIHKSCFDLGGENIEPSGLDGHQGVWFNTLVSASFGPCLQIWP